MRQTIENLKKNQNLKGDKMKNRILSYNVTGLYLISKPHPDDPKVKVITLETNAYDAKQKLQIAKLREPKATCLKITVWPHNIKF